MSLFCKHLLRSIKKRPLQPIILTLTVILSVALVVASLTLGVGIEKENSERVAIQFGSADFTVGLNSSSESRFMFESDAQAILGEKASVVGTYKLIATDKKDGSSRFALAADYYDIEEVFDLSFTEFSKIDRDNLSRAALITEEYANKHGLSLGDTIELELFGIAKKYTVFGISPQPYPEECEMLLDIRGVIAALGKTSIFISALGDSFMPSSTLYVDVKDGEDITESISLLKESSDYATKTYTEVSAHTSKMLNTSTLSAMLTICIILTCAVASIVTFSCFYILSVQRRDENELFLSAGAAGTILNLMQYVEVLIYWLIGAPFGVLLSLPLLKLTEWLVGFRHASAVSSMGDILLGSSLLLITLLLTVTLFILTKRTRSPLSKGNYATTAVSLVATVLSILTAFLVGKARLIIGVSAIFMIIALLFLLAPTVLRAFINLLVKLREKSYRSRFCAPSFLYGAKNLYNIKVLHNAARLISLLVAILITAFSIIFSSRGYIKSVENFLDGEYIVLNATESCHQRIKDADGVYARKLYQAIGMHDNGYSTLVFSAENKDAFSPRADIDFLPSGNEAILSSATAGMLSLDVGDAFTLELENREIELVVKDISYSGVSSVIIDSDYFGLGHNMLLCKSETEDTSHLVEIITESAARELAAIIKTDDLFEAHISSLEVYLNSGYLLIAALSLFSIIGLCDNLYESYKHREGEFLLYKYAGMSKAQRAKMKISELCLAALLGVILGSFFGVIMTVVMNQTLLSINFELFISLFALL